MTCAPDKSLSSHHLGRVLALRVLFEIDLTGHQWEVACDHQAQELAIIPPVASFARKCVMGILDHRRELDQLIQHFAPAWPLSQLAVVDRNILRLALFELHVAHTAPPRVIINEAVELAKEYGEESSPRFVNGVLGSAYEEHSGSPGGAGK